MAGFVLVGIDLNREIIFLHPVISGILWTEYRE